MRPSTAATLPTGCREATGATTVPAEELPEWIEQLEAVRSFWLLWRGVCACMCTHEPLQQTLNPHIFAL